KLYDKYRQENSDFSIVIKMITDLMNNNEYYHCSHFEIIKNIEIIFYNSRNWKYEINLKGFFLYLFIQANEKLKEEEIKRKIIKKESKRNKNKIENSQRKITRIRNEVKRLLSNEIIQRKCPFLKSNEDFMKVGFNT